MHTWSSLPSGFEWFWMILNDSEWVCEWFECTFDCSLILLIPFKILPLHYLVEHNEPNAIRKYSLHEENLFKQFGKFAPSDTAAPLVRSSTKCVRPEYNVSGGVQCADIRRNFLKFSCQCVVTVCSLVDNNANCKSGKAPALVLPIW